MCSNPLIIGIRHHSPACARLVAERIRTLKPAYVLIEGPADFNGRLDELMLPHQLPIALYSYLSGETEKGERCHHGSWLPLAEHTPEWQALKLGQEVGAALRFIDLPAWQRAYPDESHRNGGEDTEEVAPRSSGLSERYQRELDAKLLVDDDAQWDELFEDYADLETLSTCLETHFIHLRHDGSDTPSNQAREQMMAQWIAWAMAQERGTVLVVCGGYHAPALARLWRASASRYTASSEEPATPQPKLDLRQGCFLVPYTYKRLDALTGYASGMPSPAFYQWWWEAGPEGAARQLLQAVLTRLREKKLPASTADFVAIQVRALGLARLRGHRNPLRCDWLDALAGALVKDALEVILPWSYRGAIRAGTDPVLVHTMEVLAGDQAGLLAPDTPQPPLLASLWNELEAAGISMTSQPTDIELDLLTAPGRLRSQLLHRAALLELPGFVRSQGPQMALSGESQERWKLSKPYAQHAALIEAGSWGATLLDAARAKLEDNLRLSGGRIAALAACLNQAAFAGLHDLSQTALDDLQTAVAQEAHFEALGSALFVLFTLLRHGQLLGMAGAPVLQVIVEAGIDRALWLLEVPAAVPAAKFDAHIQGFIALRQIALDIISRDTHADTALLSIDASRILSVMERKAANTASAPVSRGAALGVIISLGGHFERDLHREQALGVLNSMQPAHLGDAVSGLLALAREALLHDSQFVAGLDSCVQSLDDVDFVKALPALRAAFTWLPTRERGNLAEKVLGLYQAQHLSRHTLTVQQSPWRAELIAANRLAEQQVLDRLAEWGIRYPEGESA